MRLDLSSPACGADTERVVGAGQCPDSILHQFSAWKSSAIQGGFIWLFDDVQKCQDSGVCSEPMNAAAYAEAIINGLS